MCDFPPQIWKSPSPAGFQRTSRRKARRARRRKLLGDFVSALPAADVKLEAPEGSQALKVSGQRSQATIRGMDPSEFPGIPTGDAGEQSITLDATELSQIIKEVEFSAATDDARPVFTGVLTRVRNERLTMAGADSFRLAVATVELPGAAAQSDVLIPAHALKTLRSILPAEGSATMTITSNRNQALFRASDIEMVTNLIAGQFPNFEAILPKSHSTRVTLPTDQFKQAAKTTTLFARDSANIVRLKVEAGEPGGLTPGVVTLQATADEVGDTTTTIEEAAVDGGGMEIIFNVKYLTDVLGVIDTPQVALELNSPQSPGVIRPVGARGEQVHLRHHAHAQHAIAPRGSGAERRGGGLATPTSAPFASHPTPSRAAFDGDYVQSTRKHAFLASALTPTHALTRIIHLVSVRDSLAICLRMWYRGARRVRE